MSAAVLREAAALMRRRAEAATPGPWSGGGLATCMQATVARGVEQCYGAQVSAPSHLYLFAGARGTNAKLAEADGSHVASWHPATALAVADLLDALAEEFGDDEDYGWADYPPRFALAVARAYLGDAS